MDQALYLNFECLAGSKVIRWNYCTRMNIRKGREPGNEAKPLALTASLAHFFCSLWMFLSVATAV